MASGEFSRGKESIRAEGGIVMVGNFDVDVEQQQRIGHLLSPLPPEMRDDTAFQDRIHAYAPGWDFPKLNPNEHLTNHFGLVSDFLSECWSRLRDGEPGVGAAEPRASGAARSAAATSRPSTRRCRGLIKLLFPDPNDAGPGRGSRMDRSPGARIPPAGEGAAEALPQERVPEHPLQLHARASRASSSSWRRRSCTATRRSTATRCRPGRCGRSARARARRAPASTGSRSPWARAAVSRSSISRCPPPSARASRWASRTSTPARRSWSATATLAAMSSRFSCAPWTRTSPEPAWGFRCWWPWSAACSSATPEVARSSWAPSTWAARSRLIPNAVAIAELAVDKQAATLLMPVAARRALNDLPDELWTKINIEFYSDPADGVFKALLE